MKSNLVRLVFGLAVASSILAVQESPGQHNELTGDTPSVNIIVLGDQQMVVEVGGVRYTLPKGVLPSDETLKSGSLVSRLTLDRSGSRVIFKTFSRQMPGTQLWGGNYSWDLAKGEVHLVARRGDRIYLSSASQPNDPWASVQLVWSSHPEFGWDGSSVVFHGPTYIVRWVNEKLSITGWMPAWWFLPGHGMVEIRPGEFLVSAYRVVGNLPEGNILLASKADQRIFSNPLKSGYWQFERIANGELLAKPTSAGVMGWVAPTTTLRWTGEGWVEYIKPAPPVPAPPPPPPPPPPPTPPAPTIGVVVNAMDPSLAMYPGGYITVYGANLDLPSILLVEWQEFVPLWQGPGQINFQIPVHWGLGKIRIEIRRGTQSAVTEITLQQGPRPLADGDSPQQ